VAVSQEKRNHTFMCVLISGWYRTHFSIFPPLQGDLCANDIFQGAQELLCRAITDAAFRAFCTSSSR
jgi:hypothetical protein